MDNAVELLDGLMLAWRDEARAVTYQDLTELRVALASPPPPVAQPVGVVMPRFPMTYCSQCGNEQGPGDEGASSCADHRKQVLTGIERAAGWVEARCEAYQQEHGSIDPDTGTEEYPGDGAEYVGELNEIAEGIRALDKLTVKP